MLDVIEKLKDSYNIYIIEAFPNSSGTAIDYMRSLGVDVLCSHYYQIRYDLNENKFEFLKKTPERIISLVFSYFFVNFNTVSKLKKMKIDCVYSNASMILAGVWIKRRLKIPHIWHFENLVKKIMV